jgi:hypothetical protein
MEYWHDIQTEKSWAVLKEIKGKFSFILIGGWAVYLWTRSHKSKDVDIIVDFRTLGKLKKMYDLRKNDILRKYEIKINDIDIDIYVKHYSQIAMPLESAETAKTEGFVVAKPEFLLLLKQTAEMERKESEKGEKDRIDIIDLLLKCDIDFKKYRLLLRKNKKEHLMARLASIIRTFGEPDYFGMNPRQFKLAKKEILEKLRAV